MKTKQYNHNLLVLVLTPTGKDAELVCQFIKQAKLNSLCCGNLKELTGQIMNGHGPAVIAEEALNDTSQTVEFLRILENQPEWSDVPLLVIRSHRSYSPYIEQIAKKFNSTILQRPIHLPTFLSAVQSAVEARSRQIEVTKRTEELKTTNRLLNETKIHLEAAQSIAKIGSWEWDLQNNKIHWSEEVYRIFGINHSKNGFTYDKFLSFVHPADRQAVKESVNNALYNNRDYSIEHRIIRKDGVERIVKERADVIFDDANKPVRMIGTIQDITEDKIKEERLRKQDVEIKSQAELLSLAHDIIIVHDLDGKITFWNKEAENTYGWKKEEVLGKVTHKILKTRFPEPVLKIISDVSRKSSWEGELIHKTKKGKEVVVDSRWALQKDENGKPSAILEIERDITQRKSAETQTEQARKFAEGIIETIQEALVVLDSKLKIISANDTFYQTFGLDGSQIKRKYIYKINKSQWNIPELRNLLEDILPKNTSLEGFEREYTPPKGHTMVLLLNARRIYYDSKKTGMILLSIQDVTSRKHQEQMIRELTEELLLAEENQRQKIAIKLHDSIGQILAFTNRELGTLQKNADSHMHESLGHIRKQIGKAIKQSRELTRDLSSPTLNTFGLGAGIEELAEEFERQYNITCHVQNIEQTKNIEKKVQLLLYRSAKELLNNVAQHAKAKNVYIELKTRNNWLNLTVSDDGKGLDVSILDNVDPDKQGFGLFSIRQRLTNLGGSFNIESEKRKGTKVILQAPIHMGNKEKGKNNGY